MLPRLMASFCLSCRFLPPPSCITSCNEGELLPSRTASRRIRFGRPTILLAANLGTATHPDQMVAKRNSEARQRARVPLSEPPESQLDSFVAKFDPSVANLIRDCRSAVRKRLPTAIEQVYDNYNFLAIGFCTSERTSDCIVSLAASANGVALSFYYGATLSDPDRVSSGRGKQNRFIRLASKRLSTTRKSRPCYVPP